MTLAWVSACSAPVDAGALLLAQHVLVGTLDGTVHGLRRDDGAVAWETRPGRLAVTSLQTLDDHTVIAGIGVRQRGRGALVALDVRDGSVGWRWQAAGTIKGAIAVAGPRVIAASYFNGGGDVACVEYRRRTPVWRRRFDGWMNGALLHEDMVFAPSMNHHLYCLAASSGRTRWAFQAGGLVCALPLVHRDHVYFGAHDAVCYALDFDGRLVWRAEMADRISGGLAAYQDLVIIGGWDAQVRALEAATGRERWRYDAGAPIVATPLVDRGTVYIGTDGGRLLALTASTGRLAAAFPHHGTLDREIKSTPVAHDGMLFFGALDGGAYAIRVGSGLALQH
jgi:outer membrane protein assembly factor BamB